MEKEHYDKLIEILMELTFHHSDETAKPIIDYFVEKHPELLDVYTIEELYKF